MKYGFRFGIDKMPKYNFLKLVKEKPLLIVKYLDNRFMRPVKVDFYQEILEAAKEETEEELVKEIAEILIGRFINQSTFLTNNRVRGTSFNIYFDDTIIPNQDLRLVDCLQKVRELRSKGQ